MPSRPLLFPSISNGDFRHIALAANFPGSLPLVMLAFFAAFTGILAIGFGYFGSFALHYNSKEFQRSSNFLLRIEFRSKIHFLLLTR